MPHASRISYLTRPTRKAARLISRSRRRAENPYDLTRPAFRFTVRRTGCNNGARNFGQTNLELRAGADNENDSPNPVGNRSRTPRTRSPTPRLARTRAPARTCSDGRLRARGPLAHRLDHTLPRKVRRSPRTRLRSLHRPRSLPRRPRARLLRVHFPVRRTGRRLRRRRRVHGRRRRLRGLQLDARYLPARRQRLDRVGRTLRREANRQLRLPRRRTARPLPRSLARAPS